MQCLKKNELKEGDKSDLQDLLRIMAEAKLKGRLIEKTTIVTRSDIVKRVNGKEYRYASGLVAVRVPPDLVGKRVRVVIVPVSED